MSEKEKKNLTTSSGIPVDNDQASISTGLNGPTVLQDVHLIDKLAHFDRERIPERVVHAKGAGAFGYFEVTHDVTKYTKADFLSEVGKKTDLFVRFSTVGGEKGSADSARDPRGFAVKFYTNEGNYDLVGNNTPIFFIRDALKFPDFIHTQKRMAKNNLKSATMMWDFWSLTPESLHQVMFLFTDRGTPATYVNMHGFGSHTYMWYNEKNEHVWVKYHWITDQGIVNLTNDESITLAGTNPDHATEHLYNSIENGNYPSWTLYIQIMTPEEAEKYEFNPFDITKVWFHKDFPLIPVGKMVLNRNPENYFAQVEQSAFSPSNFVPGIAPSPDKLLQGRLFAYPDTQRHRLGANFAQLEINKPKSGVNNYQRDSYMALQNNGGSGPVYYPNSFSNVAPNSVYAPPALEVNGIVARHEHPLSDIDFYQPGEFWRRVLKDEDKKHLVDNICGSIGSVPENIKYREIALFYKADAEMGEIFCNKLGLDVKVVEKLAAMSQEERVSETT